MGVRRVSRGAAAADEVAVNPRRSPSARYRCSDWPALACRQPLQVHVGPQLQTSPHWHEADGWSAGFWQPQVHSEPVQTEHAQAFD
jgi:hypothetical protein